MERLICIHLTDLETEVMAGPNCDEKAELIREVGEKAQMIANLTDTRVSVFDVEGNELGYNMGRKPNYTGWACAACGYDH